MLAYNVQEVADERFLNVSVLHRDTTGIICMCRQGESTHGSWENYYGRYKNVLHHLEEMEDLNDIFISQNTFKKCRRSVSNLLELNALYLDIDGYKLEPKITQAQIVSAVEDYVASNMIPQPTMIINSGHGINLVWKIKRVPAEALPLWQAMADYLMQVFEEFRPDSCSKDCARVFRVTGSYNQKRLKNEIVQVISYVPIEYDLHDLQKEYISFNDKSSRKDRSPVSTESSEKRPVYKLLTKLSLHYNRLMDLLQLCEMRNYEMVGYRENILFLIRYYSNCFCHDPDKAIEDMLEINRKFTDTKFTCSEQKVLRLTKSAEKAAKENKYNYRTSTLIKMFDITPEEQRKLSTLISKEEKARRDNLRKKAKRRNSKGETKRQSKLNKRKALAIELAKQGITQAAIAKQLGVSIRTVQNYVREQQ